MLKKSHALLALTVLAATAQAATIHVPQDRSTIQAAIDAAVAGDTVLVAPGTYHEVINFKGKAITVTSSDGAKKTIIDADMKGPVVSLWSGETRAAVLSGFTLQNGSGQWNGGGVYITMASPTVRDNIVRHNTASAGNGIGLSESSALIVNNHVLDNRGGSIGGGIYLSGGGDPELTDNLIEYNQTDGEGGGIGMNSVARPLLARNVIRRNRAGERGGGVATVNVCTPTFIDNLVHENSAPAGGGLSLIPPFETQGGLWVNNTVAHNEAITGSELYTNNNFASQLQLTNNIFVTSKGATSLYCTGEFDPVSPVFRRNDVYATNGAAIGGVCAAAAGQSGNISADPLFNSAGKGAKAFALTAGSPAIDVGAKTTVPGETDLLGHKRRVDGNGDDRKVIDLGAIEYGAH